MKALIATTWALAILVTAFALSLFIFATEYETGQGGAYGWIFMVMIGVLMALTVKEEKS